MTKTLVRLRCSNGLHFATFVPDVLRVVADEFDFVESTTPDVEIFAPDGRTLPRRESGPVTVGYFIENSIPDLSLCDWAFGIHDEERISNERFCRIPWRGFACQPTDLLQGPIDVSALLREKTAFCNYMFTSCTPFRERFFRELSRYKSIAAPCDSMRNMEPIDDAVPIIDLWSPTPWRTKREFQRRFKFSIAFENYSYPGYDTEKLVDALLADTVPIYFGNPDIHLRFNPRRFINGHEFLAPRLRWLAEWLQERSQHHMAIRRGIRVPGRVTNRMQAWGRKVRMQLLTADYSELIARVIEIDRDDELYLSYLREPCFTNNAAPSMEKAATRWRMIFQRASHASISGRSLA